MHRNFVRFAVGLELEGLENPFDGAPVILITVDDYLSIIILGDSVIETKYVDVPLDNISGVRVNESGGPFQTTCNVSIDLVTRQSPTLYLNAVGHPVSILILNVNDKTTARDIGNRVLSQQSTFNSRFRSLTRESDVLDVSQKYSRTSLGHEDGTVQKLMSFAVSANTLIAEEDAKKVITPFERTQMPDQVFDPSGSREENSRELSAISPIGSTLEIDSRTNGNMYLGSPDWENQVSNKLLQDVNGYNSSPNGTASSVQLLQGVDGTENAPYFEEEQIESQIQRVGPEDMPLSNHVSDISQSPGGDRIRNSSPTRQAVRTSTNVLPPDLSSMRPSTKMNTITTSHISGRIPDHEGGKIQNEVYKDVKPSIIEKTSKTTRLDPTVAPKSSKQSSVKPEEKVVAQPKGKVKEVQPSEEISSAVKEEMDDVFDIPHSSVKVQAKNVPRSRQKTYSRSRKKITNPIQTSKKDLPQAKVKGRVLPNGKSLTRGEDPTDGSYIENETDEIEDDGPSTGKRKRNRVNALPTSITKSLRPRTLATAPADSPIKTKPIASKSTTNRVNAKKRRPSPAVLPRSRPQRAAAIQAKQKIQSHSIKETVSSQVFYRRDPSVQDAGHKDDADLPLEQGYNADIPPQSQPSTGDEVKNGGNTTMDVEQEDSPSKKESSPELPVLQPGQKGNIANHNGSSKLGLNHLGLQPGMADILSNLVQPQTPQRNEIGYDEYSNIDPDPNIDDPALGVDGSPEKSKNTNFKTPEKSDYPATAPRSPKSTAVLVDRHKHIADMDHNLQSERETPATSNILGEGLAGTTVIQEPPDARAVKPDQKVASSVVSDPGYDLGAAVDVAGSSAGHSENTHGYAIAGLGDLIDGDEMNEFTYEELNQHFDQAKAFTDLDSINGPEAVTPERVVPYPVIFNEPKSRESMGAKKTLGTTKAPGNKDYAGAIYGTKYPKAIAGAGSEQKAQKTEKSRTFVDRFAAKLNGALSQFIPKPGPPVSRLYRGNRKLGGFQLTPETSISHQPPDQSEVFSHEDARVNSDRALEYSSEDFQRSIAPSNRNQAGQVVQTPLLKPQKAPVAPEAVMVAPAPMNDKDDISRAQVKAESQKSQVIVISSRENTDSGDSSEAQELETLEPLVQERPLRNKRKSADTMKRESKKLKVSTPKRFKATTTSSREKVTPHDIQRDVRELNAEEYLNRKAAIISFSAKGPQNQGIINKQAPSRASLIEHEDTQNAVAKVSPAPKRKKPTSGTKRTYEKRRRTETGSYVSSKHQVNPKGVEWLTSPPLLIPSRYQGSQSTKVDSKGSPIPMSYPPRNVSAGLDIHHLMAKLSDAEDENLWTQALVDDEDSTMKTRDSLGIELPALQNRHTSGIDWMEKLSSSIGKLLPSSPTAPSRMLQDMTAHRIQPSGQFVNVQTESVVRVAHLQDPFLGKPEGRASKFLQRLRASSKDVRGEALRGNAPRKEPSHRRVPFATVQDHDPDKTLVGTDSGPYYEPSSPSSGDSSSSCSSKNGKQLSSSVPSYDATHANASKQWRDALRPYQQGTLEALYDVSNVSIVILRREYQANESL